MIEKFFPDLMVERVHDVHIDLLIEKDIRGLILDIDNTLVASSVKDADKGIIDWIIKTKNAGMKVCIVSNASKKRVTRFNKKLKLFAVHRAYKPANKAFIEAADNMGTRVEQTAVIGDQIFTDIYGGNRLKMFTVLVKPIHKSEIFLVRMKRFIENIVLRIYREKMREKE